MLKLAMINEEWRAGTRGTVQSHSPTKDPDHPQQACGVSRVQSGTRSDHDQPHPSLEGRGGVRVGRLLNSPPALAWARPPASVGRQALRAISQDQKTRVLTTR